MTTMTMEENPHEHTRNRSEALESLQRPARRRHHVSSVCDGADLYPLPQDGEGDVHRGSDPGGLPLRDLRGLDLKNHYKKVLDKLGTETQGRVREIYAGAATNIDVMTRLVKPQPGERCNEQRCLGLIQYWERCA